MAEPSTGAAVKRGNPQAGSGGALYGLGMIGALVYYWRHAEGSGERIRAVGKATVWPAFVVYGLLRHQES